MSAPEKLEFVVTPPDRPDEPDQIRRFDDLVRTHRGRVYGLCYRYAGNRADAEDLAQEVFLRAYRGLSGFSTRAKIISHSWMDAMCSSTSAAKWVV